MVSLKIIYTESNSLRTSSKAEKYENHRQNQKRI